MLEAFLNRPRTHTPSSPGRSSTSSTMSSVFSSSSTASTLATPQSTLGFGGPQSWGQGDASRYSPTMLRSNNPFSVRIGSYTEPQWLLTCANEGRYTPKIVHLDVNPARIKSDKDLALALRDHYGNLNRKLFRVFRLRALSTIDFVQVRTSTSVSQCLGVYPIFAANKIFHSLKCTATALQTSGNVQTCPPKNLTTTSSPSISYHRLVVNICYIFSNIPKTMTAN